jgi:hypothetical protein
MPNKSAFLDIPAGQRNSYVYRIISIERFYELFATRQNVLVSPEMWDDPFENFILKSQHMSRDGWFGQCWTRHSASDAMWRIYSTNSKGIRVRSTPASLIDGAIRSNHDASCFIGTVQYLPERRLQRFARSMISGDLNLAENAAKTLLVKRPAFRHEAEVRLLARRGQHSSGKLFKYVIDPHLLFNQLMIDPRLTPEEADNLKGEIRRKTQYRGTIMRSLLYAPPSHFLCQTS